MVAYFVGGGNYLAEPWPRTAAAAADGAQRAGWGFLLRRCLRSCPSFGSRGMWTAHCAPRVASGSTPQTPLAFSCSEGEGVNLGKCTPVSFCAVSAIRSSAIPFINWRRGHARFRVRVIAASGLAACLPFVALRCGCVWVCGCVLFLAGVAGLLACRWLACLLCRWLSFPTSGSTLGRRANVSGQVRPVPAQTPSA